MISYRLSVLAALFMLLANNQTVAHEQHDHEEEEAVSHDAHTHGKAELFVILEGEQLAIELHSPAINFLGFEHYASTTEELAKVESTKTILSDANNLFQINSATCQLIDYEIGFSSITDNGVQHDKQHKTEKHSDIEARYNYRCDRPDQVNSMRTTISDKFPGVESLQLQWILNGRQGVVTLDNGQSQLNFGQGNSR